jgi:thymidylate synthase (FAD)
MDKKFRVKLLARIGNPQQLIYQAMHQDYSESFIGDESVPSERKCGEIVVNRLLAGDRGHFGPLENPSISLNCGYFPHSVMQQIRTHRHITFDVQSNRYTSNRFLDVASKIEAACKMHNPDYQEIEHRIINSLMLQEAIEDLIYFRPVGSYFNRNSHSYEYDESQRLQDIVDAGKLICRYRTKMGQGLSPEHARGMIPFDVRQHWVMSLNMRTLMHLLDMRWKKDAQLECQWLCDLIWPYFEAWAAEVAKWYLNNRATKARLAP